MCACDSVDEINLAVDLAPRAWENGWRLRLAPGYLTGGLWTCPMADICLLPFVVVVVCVARWYMAGKFISYSAVTRSVQGWNVCRECNFRTKTSFLSRCLGQQKSPPLFPVNGQMNK